MIEIDRMVLATDWPAVRDIYADGLATGLAAFLSNPPSQNEWDRAHLPLGRIFARAGDAVHGPSPLLPTLKGRPAPQGQRLRQSKRTRKRCRRRAHPRTHRRLGSGAVPDPLSPNMAENTASRALHAKCRFRKVGVRERLGYRNGVWQDDVSL